MWKYVREFLSFDPIVIIVSFKYLKSYWRWSLILCSGYRLLQFNKLVYFRSQQLIINQKKYLLIYTMQGKRTKLKDVFWSCYSCNLQVTLFYLKIS